MSVDLNTFCVYFFFFFLSSLWVSNCELVLINVEYYRVARMVCAAAVGTDANRVVYRVCVLGS